MWGPAAAAHYSIQRGAATRLSQQPEAGEVLALLDSEKLLKTAYNFPIRLRLNQQGELSNNQHESEDYDPRFILSLLAHILSPEYVVQCAKFTQSGATSLLFASLSSSCGEVNFHPTELPSIVCLLSELNRCSSGNADAVIGMDGPWPSV